MTSAETSTQNNRKWLRSFAPIWLGQAFSLLGSSLVQFALVWHLTVQTGSTAVLATATFVALLPQVLLGPFAGALVDRWDRRRVMMIADGAVALTTLFLVWLFSVDLIQVWHIYAAMFLRSLGGSFHWPAMQASTTLMVPKEHYSRLAGANQALHGLINIAAPPLGALLLSLIPIHSVLTIDIATAAIAIFPLFFIAIPRPVRSDADEIVTPTRVWQDVRTGLRYVMGWPGMMGILLMATVINFLLSPAFSFLPLLVTRHFNGGAVELGWLESGFGAGVITGGLLLSIWGGFRRKISTTMSGLIGMGAGILLVGFSSPTGYWLAFAGLVIAGLMNPLVNGPLFALLQTKVEPEMQGRVMSLVSSLSGAMAPLGMLIAAPVAERLGIQSWYIVGGLVCMLMGVSGFMIKAIYTIDEQLPGGAISTPLELQPSPLVTD